MRTPRRPFFAGFVRELAAPLVPVEPRQKPVGVRFGRQGGRLRRGRAKPATAAGAGAAADAKGSPPPPELHRRRRKDRAAAPPIASSALNASALVNGAETPLRNILRGGDGALSILRARETRKARSDAPEARRRRGAGPTLEEETETTTLEDMIEDMSSLTGDE